jgi:hypothetical protein
VEVRQRPAVTPTIAEPFATQLQGPAA